jgi:tetratricopeptide (TPR) repeat protein
MITWLFIFFLFNRNDAALGAATPSGYGVAESGNLVFVKTPWGSSVYIGPVGLDSLRTYSFEVPLSDFRAGLPNGIKNDGGTSSGDSSQLGDTGSLIAEANRFYNKGDFAKSLRYVDEVVRRDPGSVRGWVMKGSLMHVMGHKDLARQAWQKALELDPKNSQIQNILRSMQ